MLFVLLELILIYTLILVYLVCYKAGGVLLKSDMGGEIDACIGGIALMVWRWVGESTHSLRELCSLFGDG